MFKIFVYGFLGYLLWLAMPVIILALGAAFATAMQFLVLFFGG